VNLVREVQVGERPEELIGLAVAGLGRLDPIVEDLRVDDLAATTDARLPLLSTGIDPDEAGSIGSAPAIALILRPAVPQVTCRLWSGLRSLWSATFPRGVCMISRCMKIFLPRAIR
jgi:hypothetical protein